MKFKRILSLLASAAMTISALCGAMSITASAEVETGSCGDGLTYEYDSVAKSLTIKYSGEGTGVMDDYTATTPLDTVNNH